jgi:hypothetical protein
MHKIETISLCCGGGWESQVYFKGIEERLSHKIMTYFYGVFSLSIQDSHGASISELDMARDVALAPLAKIEDLPRLGDLPCLPTPPKGFRKNHKKS